MGSMVGYSKAAMERAMKVQEVILRAMAKRITWWQAAEIVGAPRAGWCGGGCWTGVGAVIDGSSFFGAAGKHCRRRSEDPGNYGSPFDSLGQPYILCRIPLRQIWSQQRDAEKHCPSNA